ncbi:hypothetical protein [Desulfomonile tiedjei]|uniref:Pilus assembly protein PilP n=1 Tax=Desulfomonile tiedjei (strain ATCC 49306 / DSM 6799 / DCB-1) TaxID=706587 RepID=I4CE94_DESTA|nr:hypothetical protein [Desulfomonile tiedjei]AFM27885.1 hypothetical protein Desti_5295 [Desulfomonile tiedjei DSM 6799]
MNLLQLKTIYCIGLVSASLFLLTGCEEANMAIDSILGRRTPVLSATPQVPSSVIPAVKRMPGEKIAPPEPGTTSLPAPPVAPQVQNDPVGPFAQSAPSSMAQAPTAPPQAAPAQVAPAPVAPGPGAPPQTAPSPAPRLAEEAAQIRGKRRVPGALSPELKQAEEGDEKAAREPFVLLRDPFKQPTEILPSECPPSMPLCRFDRSQLKLVGVMQVSDGQFKGLVEDPDGRGYFITAGMQIGGATVTQVTNKGIILHVHRTRQDVTMPLFREAREIGD